MLSRREYYIIFLILSLALHVLLFPIKLIDLSHFQKMEGDSQHVSKRINLKSFEFIKHKGDVDSLEKEGKDMNSMRRERLLAQPTEFDGKSQQGVKNPTPPAAQERKIRLSDLAQPQMNPKRPTAKGLLKQNEKKFQTVTARQVKQFISDTPSRISAADMLKNLGNSDMSVAFGVPEGMVEDEYNPAEMVYYGFRRRLAMAYISAFFDKLNEFNLKNPHLQFPMTKDEEELTGMVTYDEKGNIMRIRMVRWTEKQRLQDFFVEVMESLGTLPNPPDQIVENGEFTVFYTLNIKN